MIDENNGCITKSKLTTTIKTLTKYNDRSRVAANQSKKRNQRRRIDKNVGRKHTKERKMHTYKQTYCGHRQRERERERVKQKMKNEVLYVLLFLK